MRATSSIRPAAAILRSVPTARSTSPVPARTAALAVLEAAAELEPELAEAVAWYLLVPIAELDQLTAGELVAQGREAAVLAFLRAVIDGRRG